MNKELYYKEFEQCKVEGMGDLKAHDEALKRVAAYYLGKADDARQEAKER